MALIEEEHIITKISDGDQVVGDEHIGQSQFLLQFPQQTMTWTWVWASKEEMASSKRMTSGLQATAERCTPLELAAGELMGKSSGEVSRQAHQLQQPGNFPRTVQPALFPPFPDSKPLANDILNPEAGIGGGGVVLENYAEFVLQVPTPGTGAVDRNAIQKSLAAVRPEQAAQHPAHGGLSAARLSQNTQAGSFFYGEGHVEQHLLAGVAEYPVLPLAAEN